MINVTVGKRESNSGCKNCTVVSGYFKPDADGEFKVDFDEKGKGKRFSSSFTNVLFETEVRHETRFGSRR